jgi:hypothetical protein
MAGDDRDIEEEHMTIQLTRGWTNNDWGSTTALVYEAQ